MGRTHPNPRRGGSHETIWSTGHHGLFSWRDLMTEMKKRGYQGDICLPAEYTAFEGGNPSGMQMGNSCLDYLQVDISYLQQLMAEKWAATNPECRLWL